MELHCPVIWIHFIWCSAWLKLYIFIVYFFSPNCFFLISTFRSLCGQPIKYLKSSQMLSGSFTKCSTQSGHICTVSGTPLDCWTWPRRRSSLCHTFLPCFITHKTFITLNVVHLEVDSCVSNQSWEFTRTSAKKVRYRGKKWAFWSKIDLGLNLGLFSRCLCRQWVFCKK